MDERKLRINLGSGQRKFGTPEHPWLNVDVNPKWEPDLLADGADLSIIASDTAEYVVLHHVLEHFGLGEADTMLKECYRILAPGGSLIVCVPNLRELARAWLRGEITDYIYCVNLYGAYMDDEADRHKWGFGPSSLIQTLFESSAWGQVKAFDYRTIDGANIAKDFWILALEAVK